MTQVFDNTCIIILEIQNIILFTDRVISYIVDEKLCLIDQRISHICLIIFDQVLIDHVLSIFTLHSHISMLQNIFHFAESHSSITMISL